MSEEFLVKSIRPEDKFFRLEVVGQGKKSEAQIKSNFESMLEKEQNIPGNIRNIYASYVAHIDITYLNFNILATACQIFYELSQSKSQLNATNFRKYLPNKYLQDYEAQAEIYNYLKYIISGNS